MLLTMRDCLVSFSSLSRLATWPSSKEMYSLISSKVGSSGRSIVGYALVIKQQGPAVQVTASHAELRFESR